MCYVYDCWCLVCFPRYIFVCGVLGVRFVVVGCPLCRVYVYVVLVSVLFFLLLLFCFIMI